MNGDTSSEGEARALLEQLQEELQQSRWRLAEAEAIAAQERENTKALDRIARALGVELDPDVIVQRLTDEATKLTGAQFGAFFYNVKNAEGESYMLFALSGAPREAFARFGMPRNTPIFAPTFEGKGVVRIDDVTADPRYGKNPPQNGMPEGHPMVRSYLAASVVSRTGEVLGGLFFGHERAGVFGERLEGLLSAIAAHAAIAIDNARLYRAAKLNEELQTRRAHYAALQGEIGAALTRSPMVAQPSLEELGLRPTLQQCAEAIVRHLGVAFARIWTIDAAGTTLVLQASAGMYTHLDGGHARVPVGAFKIGLIAAERVAHLTNDVASDPRIGDPQWAAREKMVSFAGYPLLVGDQVAGVVAMFGREALSADTADAIHAVADSIAVAIARARAQAEQRRLQSELRTLIDTIPELAWTARADGHIDFYNRRWYAYTGTTFEQMQGWGWKMVHDPSMIDEVMERWVGSIETGAPFEMEFPLRGADGTFRWFLTRVAPLHDDSGKIVRWFGTNTDIDEQREAHRRTEALLVEVAQQARDVQAALVATRTAREVAERRVRELEAARSLP